MSHRMYSAVCVMLYGSDIVDDGYFSVTFRDDAEDI